MLIREKNSPGPAILPFEAQKPNAHPTPYIWWKSGNGTGTPQQIRIRIDVLLPRPPQTFIDARTQGGKGLLRSLLSSQRQAADAVTTWRPARRRCTPYTPGFWWIHFTFNFSLSCRKNENISDTEKVLPTSFNYYHNLIYLLQLENRIFILLELLKPVDLPPWAVFKAVLADVALRQLSYMAPRQLRGR